MTKNDRAMLFVVIVIMAMVLAGISYAEQMVNEDDLPSVIRLHIVANSDSEHDQVVKHAVRDAILKFLQDFADTETRSVSRRMLQGNLVAIKSVVQDKLYDLEQDYNVEVGLGVFNFPAKTYGSFALPSGKYEALNIVLGEGAGRNWWCVVFPNICFTKEAKTEMVSVTGHDDIRLKLKSVEVGKELVKTLKQKNNIKVESFSILSHIHSSRRVWGDDRNDKDLRH